MKMSTTSFMFLFEILAVTFLPVCFGFQSNDAPRPTRKLSPCSSPFRSGGDTATTTTTTTTTTRTSLHSSLDEMFNKNEDLLLVRQTLEEKYSGFGKLLNLNDSVWKSIGAGYVNGFTLFVPTNEALESLDATKQTQLYDERNLETTQKIASFHVINELVTAEDLFHAGGVITLGGEVPVDRSTKGGMFGMGGKEDGGVLVNQVKVVHSFPLGSGIVHEVDGLVSPNILWRYMDQLRIPGSK
ncbi:unnamed protein product [Cylindrotheca closterium]|uniref:FAS1 domain-containing protein n=1 Tax=Cylindrotheca closterium TaxID=2856 RepID=A0AAD2FWC9_9STRA|nr:unnamed protein product [Cylindrotheca closterium]